MVKHMTTWDGEAARGAQALQIESGNGSRCVHARGVVLVGVHAWSSDVLEKVICRPLLPIAGRPLIFYVLDWLRRGGIREVHVCGNSDTKVLRRALGDGARLGVSLEYWEDLMPRGPAGCARDATAGKPADVFVLVEGTTIPQTDLSALLEGHLRSQAALTLVASKPRGSPGSHNGALAPSGIYVFSPRALKTVPPTGYQDIKEGLIPNLYARGERVLTHVAHVRSIPRVSGAGSYLAANMWVVEEMLRAGSLPEEFTALNGAWVHRSALVDETARLVGPVIVGPDCEIGANAVIVGPTTMGAGCKVGRRALVSRSVLWDGCQVGASAFLDHCVLTDRAAVEAETTARSTLCVPSGGGKVGPG